MELREPPGQSTASKSDRLGWGMLLIIVILVVALAGVSIWRPGSEGRAAEADHVRQVAAKLQAAGVLDEAAMQYERYLALGEPATEEWAGIAITLGNHYLEAGRYHSALRWYYEAETVGGSELHPELAGKIVHTLERLGKPFAAQAALSSSSGPADDKAQRSADDPVVARIGEDEIRRSDIERALETMPPEFRAQLESPEGRARFLEQYVADELLWRKATKLELDRDPQILRQHQALLKQLVVSRFAEQEVLGRIEVDEADLKNHFNANPERFVPPPKPGEEPSQPSFEEVRSAVELDYRRMKLQSAYRSLLDSEMATQEVELLPENLEREP